MRGFRIIHLVLEMINLSYKVYKLIIYHEQSMLSVCCKGARIIAYFVHRLILIHNQNSTSSGDLTDVCLNVYFTNIHGLFLSTMDAYLSLYYSNNNDYIVQILLLICIIIYAVVYQWLSQYDLCNESLYSKCTILNTRL